MIYRSGDIWERAQLGINVRADSEHVAVFTSELGSQIISASLSISMASGARANGTEHSPGPSVGPQK